MNRNELVAAVAAEAGLSKNDSGEAVDAMIKVITSTLKSKGEVRLVGFGTFSVARRAASKGRNPQTGAPMDIPASNQAKFKAGKGLRDAVN